MSKLTAIFIVVLFLGFVSAFYVSSVFACVMAIPLVVLLAIGVKKIMSA